MIEIDLSLLVGFYNLPETLVVYIYCSAFQMNGKDGQKPTDSDRPRYYTSAPAICTRKRHPLTC